MSGYECKCNTNYVDDCRNNPTREGSKCILDPGMRCVDICTSMPCLNGGTCVNVGNAYRCDCATGYDGETVNGVVRYDCQVDLDECKLNGGCQNGGICHESGQTQAPDGSKFKGYQYVPAGEFRCECKKGYGPYNTSSVTIMDTTRGSRCGTDIDECLSSPCYNAGTCEDSNTPGMGGSCSQPSKDCVPPGRFFCACMKHGGDNEKFDFTGDRCQIDINECISSPCRTSYKDAKGKHFDGHCKSSTECCNQTGHFTNKAKGTGWVGIPAGEYACTCAAGYTMGQYGCTVDINECASGPCKNGATCFESQHPQPRVHKNPRTGVIIKQWEDKFLANTYHCKCAPGWFQKCQNNRCEDSNCDVNIDECQSTPCRNSAKCIDRVNEFVCDCSGTGFKGKLCEIAVDDCNSSPCLNKASCSDLVNDYKCACKEGFSGTHCETDVDECSSTPCQNGGTCSNIMGEATFSCRCTKGYHGFRHGKAGTNCGTAKNWECGKCDVDHNECSEYPPVCKNNAVCYESSKKHTWPDIYGHLKPIPIDEFRCKCSQGFTATTCEVETFVVTIHDGTEALGTARPTYKDVAALIGNQCIHKVVAVKRHGDAAVQFEVFGKMCTPTMTSACLASDQDRIILIRDLSDGGLKADIKYNNIVIWSYLDVDHTSELSGKKTGKRPTVAMNTASNTATGDTGGSLGIILGLLLVVLVLGVVGFILVRKKISSDGGGDANKAHVEMEVI